MRSTTCAAVAALATLVASSPVWAQAPAQPGDGSLFFNPGASQWAFRAAGVPWICMQDGRCVQIRFERAAPAQIAAAEITALGFADGSYYLALRHAELAGGRQQAFRCAAETCVPSELPAGEFAFLGTYAVMQQGRPLGRTAILARAADAPERSRLLWCSDRTCTEQPFTRDSRYDLTFMGAAPVDGRSRIWLRERSGNVFDCSPAEAVGEDRFECTPTGLVYPDVAAPATGEADPQSAMAAVEDAIRRGNWAEAERLIAEGRSRFPAQPQWAQFAQRLAQLRAERDSRARIDQARRLVADANRYAAAGDYRAAEAVLQEAARLAPGLADIAQARAEISRLRAERFRRLNERSQFVAAIKQALGGFRLWEAEGLIAEALRRFPNDPDFRNFDRQVGQMRAQAEWQGRMRRAGQFVAAAREAMSRQQFAEAERQLDAAEALAMGLPEIRAARADLARQRVEADFHAADIRQFTIDIETALARRQLAQAEQMLAFATRRHPLHPGWADLRRRIDQAKASVPPPLPTQQIIFNARAAIARKDWAAAERFVDQAERLDPNAPAVQAARADLVAARNAAAAQAQAFINAARAAIAQKNWPAAERAVADAEAADPHNPAVRQVKADLAAAKAATPAPIPTAALIADARAAMAKKDWAEASRLIGQAERLDPNAPSVKAARADLVVARNAAAAQAQAFINAARAAIAQKNWPAAERAVADAEAADPQSAAVRQVKADLAAAKTAAPPPIPTAALIADARAAMAKKDWAEASRLIGQAERLDPNAPSVKAARADLVAARNAAAAQAQAFINAARAAIAQKNWPAAERAVADAEAADPQSAAVRQVKAELKAARP